MGGEWWFNFLLEKKDSFDLKAYQALLPKLKAEFEPQFKDAKFDFNVVWCPDDKLPPEDNVFAKFTYVCSRNHSSWGADHPVWYLFWDPTIATEQYQSNIHGKCGPCFGIGNKLMVRLTKAFPEHFEHYNDYVFDAQREYESYYEENEESEVLDFTACDKDDCGYCGKCPY